MAAPLPGPLSTSPPVKKYANDNFNCKYLDARSADESQVPKWSALRIMQMQNQAK